MSDSTNHNKHQILSFKLQCRLISVVTKVATLAPATTIIQSLSMC